MALIEVASFSQTWIYIPPPAPLPYDLINAPREYFDDGPGGFETADLPKFLQTLRGRVLVTVTLDSVSIMDAAERPAQGPIVPIIIDGVTSDFLRANYNIAIGYPDSGPHKEGDVLYTPAPPAPPPLFDDNANQVNFNQLDPSQKLALQNGADRYHALGGDDDVTLPDSSGVVPGGFSAVQIFDAGSNNDKITGGKLDDHVDLGGGNDTFYGSPGKDAILGGPGQDKFDYQSGKYANFKDFAPTTVTAQTLNGGVEDPGQQDLLKLPGAASDYRFRVTFGPTWGDTKTSVETLDGSGLPKVILTTNEIEKATFDLQKPINEVGLTANSLTVEMALLTREVYGLLPTLEHKAEPLLSKSFGVPRSTDPVTAPAVTERHWHAVSALELGILPANYIKLNAPISYGTLDWSFVGGHYAAYDADRLSSVLASSILGDQPEANAMVLTGDVPGIGKSLAVVFRGTDQYADFFTYVKFENYYDLYKPLIDGIKTFLQDHPDYHVLVSGHSLGAGVVPYFLNESFLSGKDVRAWTYGSPGSEVTANFPIYNLVHTEDAITKVPLATSGAELATVLGLGTGNLALAAALAGIVGYAGKTRSGSDVLISSDVSDIWGTDEHSQRLYTQDLIKLTEFAGELGPGGPFKGTPFATAILNGDTYTGPSIQIGLGKPINLNPNSTKDYFGPYFPTIRAYSGDNYVLANNKNIDDDIVVSQLNLAASGSRKIDGGTGINDTLILPFGHSLFSKTANGAAWDITFTPVNGTPEAVGTLYRVERIEYRDTTERLDGKAETVQNAKPGQTAFAVAPGIDYADAGDGNMSVTGTSGHDSIYLGSGNKTVLAGAGNDFISVKPGGSNAAALMSVAYTIVINGGSGADVMFGGSGNETFYVDNLGDIVDDDGGLDSVVSSISYLAPNGIENLKLVGAGNLIGTGNDLDNSITGNGAANVLNGLGGDDTLIGGLGNDTLNGGAGADRLDGGAGIDTASYSAATDGVTVNLTLTSPQVSAGEASGDVLISIENLIGGAGNDTLTGNSGNNVLEGGAGADGLDGGAGTDTAGYATSGSGIDVSLMTGLGSVGDAAGDTLANIENLTGSNFDDVLEGNGGNNVLAGGANGLGGDTASYANATAGVTVSLATTLAQNTVGAGIDTLLGFENLTGSAFNDKLTGSSLANVLVGGAGNDLLMGGAGNDTLQGGADDDILIGGAGLDALDGGDGSDTASYAASTIAVTVDLTAGTGLGADAQGDTLTNIENIIGSAFNDTLTGDGNDNVLTGGAGKDTLAGGLNGVGGDTASYATAAVGVTVSLLLQVGTQNTVGAGFDTLTGIENLIGSAFNDALTGDANSNKLTGGAGNDMLLGGAGDDTLDGGVGTADTASYAAAGSGVTVSLATAGAQDTVGAGIDTLIGIERLIGSAGNDTLTGDLLANRIDGGAGDDTIDGGAGNDILLGGANSAAGDTLSYASAAAGITVSLAIQDGVTAQNTLGAGIDVLSGFENLTGSALNDTLTGSGLANVIMGGAGNDIINGGAGNDNLQGGAGTDTLKSGVGNDMLTGGADADAFVFNTALNALTNVDDITDFEVGIDHIGLENAILTKLAAIGTLSEDFFHVGASAADLNDFIIYDDATGALYYDSNGSATGQQVQFAHLAPGLNLTHADFFVV